MNIYEKLLDIMKNVQYLAKDDKVDFGKTSYKAMSEEKVTATMRKQMVEHGLIVFPIEQSTRRDGQITHVDVKYRIVNTEAPEETVEVVSCGDGWDSQDKGSGKAMTYAMKYMWLRTFAIPTGEDPDKICNEEIEDKISKAKENVGFTCERCHFPLKPYKFDGKQISLRAHAESSMKNYNACYCMDCINELYPENPWAGGKVEWI